MGRKILQLLHNCLAINITCQMWLQLFRCNSECCTRQCPLLALSTDKWYEVLKWYESESESECVWVWGCLCQCVHACVRVFVCACVCMEWTWSIHYVGISTSHFILYYASAIHKHTHTRILKPFEDSEQTGLKVDIALNPSLNETARYNEVMSL